MCTSNERHTELECTVTTLPRMPILHTCLPFLALFSCSATLPAVRFVHRCGLNECCAVIKRSDGLQ
ncbi:hypothetical protein M758_6G085900 [Ceratodon purpureus]|nr:hypothetical protein M758_6G085900 [Ceratodon purpureus]